MILTCPACGTQYVVKDGAIPPGGRRVRCASCRHSWHQDPPAEESTLQLGSAAAPAIIEPDEAPAGDRPETPTAWPEAPDQPLGDLDAAEEAEADSEPPGYAPVEEVSDAVDVAAPDYDEPVEAFDTGSRDEDWTPVAAEEDDFSPFAPRERTEAKRRSPVVAIVLLVVLVAALAAAFWFFAPAEWKQRLGLAASGQTPLQLMMTHSDRQRLASGNELLSVSGRVINPTDRQQPVPPITAELRSSAGRVVYRWTIAPPTRNLAPGASATFNSSELNVPAGGEELTISLGQPSA